MSELHAGNGWASDAPTPAQLKEFFAQIEKGRITKGKLQGFLRGGARGTAHEQLREWVELYGKHGIVLDISSIMIPAHQPGFDRLIVVAKGLTPNQVYGILVKQFDCWRYTDNLDKAIAKNDRSPAKGGYTIWVRDRVEADEELKNLSADQLKEQKILGITLLERLLYELKYWDETGEHLDVQNWTLCSGSRYAGVGVPSVYCFDSSLRVLWYYSRSHVDNLRSRAVVPNQP